MKNEGDQILSRIEIRKFLITTMMECINKLISLVICDFIKKTLNYKQICFLPIIVIKLLINSGPFNN
jgi:hypothetical protein